MSTRKLTRALAVSILASTLAGCGLGAATATPAPAATASVAASAGDPLQRGLAAHTAGRLDEAIVLYYQALASDPSNKFAFFNLG